MLRFGERMKVGCIATHQNQELLKRLPNESLIFGTIDPAMNIVTNNNSSYIIIYSRI